MHGHGTAREGARGKGRAEHGTARGHEAMRIMGVRGAWGAQDVERATREVEGGLQGMAPREARRCARHRAARLKRVTEAGRPMLPGRPMLLVCYGPPPRC